MKENQGVTLTEEIANTIRNRILLGEYRIGEKLNETKISTELRVSRTPVREAIKQLETEGLIDNIPNRGSYALGFSVKDVEDIYSVRAVVEGLAVRWAAEKISDEEAVRLRDAYELMEFYTIKKNSRKVMENNKKFHEILYYASRSRFLIQTLKSYQEYVQQSRKATVYCEENLVTILEEHQSILKAVEARNGKLAESEILRHLTNSRERYHKAKAQA
jgi:GntR family transcriptional regulator, rspAB operon transcriptional repressor